MEGKLTTRVMNVREKHKHIDASAQYCSIFFILIKKLGQFCTQLLTYIQACRNPTWHLRHLVFSSHTASYYTSKGKLLSQKRKMSDFFNLIDGPHKNGEKKYVEAISILRIMAYITNAQCKNLISTFTCQRAKTYHIN